jgi:hypothetical protein
LEPGQRNAATAVALPEGIQHVKAPHPSLTMKSLRLGRLKLVLLRLTLPSEVRLTCRNRPSLRSRHCAADQGRRYLLSSSPTTSSGQGLSRWPKGGWAVDCAASMNRCAHLPCNRRRIDAWAGHLPRSTGMEAATLPGSALGCRQSQVRSRPRQPRNTPAGAVCCACSLVGMYG